MAELPRVFGDYVLLESLGAGGMGDVHLARPIDARSAIPTPVVIKRLHARLAHEERFVKRFHHEARIAITIDSPYIAKVYDMGRVGDVLYIAMQLIEGWPLSRVLTEAQQRKHLFAVSSAIDLMRGVLEGLRVLHGLRDANGHNVGFVHRDISPKNVIVGRDGTARLIDLGLGTSRLQDWQTATGAVMGTPGYMAPEQVVAEDVDARTDLFAAGVIFYELLTGQPFIHQSSLREMLMASIGAQFRDPSVLRPELEPALDQIVRRALAADPKDRFQSAAEFLAALESAAPRQERVRESIETLVGPSMIGELEKTRTAIDKLLSTPPLESLTPEPTEIFARASLDPTLDPTHLRTQEVPTIVDRERTKRHGRPSLSWLIAPAIIIAAAVALVILGRPVKAPAPEIIVETQEHDAPRAHARPIAVEKEEPETRSPITVEKKSAPLRPPTSQAQPQPQPQPQQKQQQQQQQPQETKPEAPRDVELAPAERVARMLERTRELAGKHPELRARVDALIIDLNSESLNPRADRVHVLEERLSALFTEAR